MQVVRQVRPVGVYGLMGVLAFVAVGALYGGYSFLSDPSGGKMGIPTEWLSRTGFSDYFIPGLILFAVLGVLPLLTVVLLWLRPDWGWMQGLENLFHVHWVWGLAFGIGLAQMIWIVYQVVTMGLLFWLQPTMFGMGLLICGLCLLPSVRAHFARR
ncbi:MAG: hypothetical protein N2318_09935 [Meiothermus sp.]|nr:hypothetical protein [Meiothermus sp.]